MAIFNSYVSSPEGIPSVHDFPTIYHLPAEQVTEFWDGSSFRFAWSMPFGAEGQVLLWGASSVFFSP